MRLLSLASCALSLPSFLPVTLRWAKLSSCGSSLVDRASRGIRSRGEQPRTLFNMVRGGFRRRRCSFAAVGNSICHGEDLKPTPAHPLVRFALAGPSRSWPYFPMAPLTRLIDRSASPCTMSTCIAGWRSFRESSSWWSMVTDSSRIRFPS